MTLFLSVLIALSLASGLAHSDPISAAIAGALISAGVGAATAATISAIATRIIIGVALSLLGQLLQGKPKRPKINDSGIQTEQTTNGDTTPQKFVVGRTGLEGHLVAPPYSRGDTNHYLTYIIEVSNIPVKGLTGRIVIDGQYSEIINEPPAGHSGSNGAKTTGASRLGGFRVVTEAGKTYDDAWMWFEDGNQVSAHPHLVEKYKDHPERPWTTAHKLKGSAYAILEFVYNRELFGGLPGVRFEVDGISLYDPRQDSSVGGSGSQRWADPSTWAFSKNPQVINYNVLRGITLPTGDVYGGGVPAEDLPLDNWFAAMNECDVLIGDRVQFEAGFEVDTNELEPLELIEEMNKASFAEMSTTAGVFRVRVGGPSEPVMSLTDADFVITEPSSSNPFPGQSDTRNAITATYVSPEDIWQGRSADPITNATWEAEDGSRRLWANIGLPAVSNKSQAQQIMQAMINDDRRFRSHSMTLPPSFARLEALDTIEWTSETNGYTAKLFEIVEIEDRPDTVQQVLRVRERDQGDVEWTEADDVPVPLARNGYVPPPNPVPVLVIPADSIVSTTRVVHEALREVIAFDVTYPFVDEVPRVEVQFQRLGSITWAAMSTGPLGRFEFVAPEAASYRFRARTFDARERPGAWTTSAFIPTESLDGAPGDIVDFFAEIVDGTMTLEWEPSPDGDLSFFRIRHALEETGATWANATTSVDKVPRPGTSVALAARTGTFLIKAYSKTGVPALGASSLVITADDIPAFDTVITDDEHTTFPGTKTNVIVDTGSLKIDDATLATGGTTWDGIEGTWDTFKGTWDEWTGGKAIGSYDFDGYIETHDATIRRVRARVDIETIRLDEAGGNWDEIPGEFDEWPGNFDDWTGDAQFADTDVHFFISATDDDPAGTPTWGPYKRFRVGDFKGRAFRFRAKLISTTNNVTPSIDTMTAVIGYNA